MTQLTPEMMLEAFPGYGLIVDMSGKIEAISSSFLEIAPMLQVGASLYEFLPLEKNVELKDILKEIGVLICVRITDYKNIRCLSL